MCSEVSVDSRGMRGVNLYCTYRCIHPMGPWEGAFRLETKSIRSPPTFVIVSFFTGLCAHNNGRPYAKI